MLGLAGGFLTTGRRGEGSGCWGRVAGELKAGGKSGRDCEMVGAAPGGKEELVQQFKRGKCWRR